MWLSDIYRAISTFIAEIEYFTILVQRKEIEDSGVLPYHAMLMLNTLIDFKISLHGVILREVDTSKEIDTSGLGPFQKWADTHLKIWLSKLPHDMRIVREAEIERVKELVR